TSPFHLQPRTGDRRDHLHPHRLSPANRHQGCEAVSGAGSKVRRRTGEEATRIRPPRAIIAAARRSPRPREPVASLMRPMMKGEMASPSMWMTSTFTATAVERIWAGTTLQRAAFRGAVLKNRKKRQTNTALQ